MPRRRAWARLALLWLAGADLRLTMLAVPPVIPAIHRDLQLDEKTVALLTGLPVLLFSLVAVGGSLLVARLGARRALLSGLLVAGLAAALRGLGPATPVLLGATFAMGVGIAISQPTFATLARRWFPREIAFATGVYANGMLAGEVIPTSLSGPVLSLLRGSWELDLAAWALPVLVGVALLALTDRPAVEPEGGPGGRWWPDWRSSQTWFLGTTLGCASLIYWGCNAFIPDYLARTRHPGLIGITLALLNFAQLPASVVVAAFPGLIGRRLPFAATGLLILVGLLTFYLAPGPLAVGAMALVGLCSGLILIFTLAQPPLLVTPDDVARMTAAVFTITYALAFTGPLVAGAVWDLTGQPAVAFAPAIMASLAMVLLSSRLRLARNPR